MVRLEVKTPFELKSGKLSDKSFQFNMFVAKKSAVNFSNRDYNTFIVVFSNRFLVSDFSVLAIRSFHSCS